VLGDDDGGVSTLVTIDTATGEHTNVGELGAGIYDVDGLAFDPLTAQLYAIDDATEELLAVDPATRKVSVLPGRFPHATSHAIRGGEMCWVDGGLLCASDRGFEMLTPPATDVVREMADASPHKPIAWCPYEGWLTGIGARDVAATLEKAGKAAVFTSPEHALRALARLAEYREFLRGES